MSTPFEHADYKPLNVSYEAQHALLSSAHWANYIAKINVGLIVLFWLCMPFAQNNVFYELITDKDLLARGTYIFALLVLTAFYLYPNLKMLHYAKTIRTAIRDNDEHQLLKAFEAQKQIYRFFALLMALYIISLVVKFFYYL